MGTCRHDKKQLKNFSVQKITLLISNKTDLLYSTENLLSIIAIIIISFIISCRAYY